MALAFGRILQGRAPTYRLLCVGLVSGAVAWASERRGMLIATLLSAIGLIVALGWIIASRTLWLGVPTVETVHTFGQLATQIGAQAREYVSPAPATPALLFAGAIAVWAAIFSCYALAFRAQSPLLALVPPLALVVFADGVLDQFLDRLGIGFLVAALAVLFADSLRRLRSWGPVWGQAGDARDRLWPVTGRNARRVGLTVLAAAVIAPWAVPGFGSNVGLGLFSVDAGAGGIGVSPFASIGAILNDPSSSTTPVFTIRASSGSYWRMLSLDRFDGTTWEATSDDGTTIPPGGDIPTSFPGQHELTQHVTVEGALTSPWLVAAGEPTSIRVGGNVSWHGASSSLQVDPWLDNGDAYVVTSARALPTDEDLRSLAMIPSDPALSVLPPGIPSAVADTAHAWTEGLPTTFDEVLSIERHLRSLPFYYDPKAAYPLDPQTLADILTTHAGFCQHFASLMAVMLRELGIPARVGYGFTQGKEYGDTWTVMASNLHTWVEVFFPGYGWLTFDPTPGGFGDPSTAPYDHIQQVSDRGGDCKRPGGCGGVDTSVTPTPPPTETPTPTTTQSVSVSTAPAETGSGSQAPNSGSGSGGAIRSALGAALLLVAIAVGVPLLRQARRERRIRAALDPRSAILVTYDIFVERAGALGLRRRPYETVDEFRRRLEGRGLLGTGLDPAMAVLATTVVQAAYGRRAPDGDDAIVVAASASSVLARLRNASSWPRRLLGAYR